MKRSEVNEALIWAKQLFANSRIALPPFGYWTLDEWQGKKDQIATICQTMLGWDITDYGMGDFKSIGSVLFTLRNGDQKNPGIGTPYAEKLIPLYEGQRLPCHFHYTKTEDIIVRAGGAMYIQLYRALPETMDVDVNSPVEVYMDGIRKTFEAGQTVLLHPGQSITLTPYLYHTFGAQKGYGDVVIGEVSSINDDNTDNHFSEPVSRFSAIEEDQPVLHPLCNEYGKIL